MGDKSEHKTLLIQNVVAEGWFTQNVVSEGRFTQYVVAEAGLYSM
jgi:hypothetical protein